MRINLGVSAYLIGGQRTPPIDRVIIDPKLWEVTHIVIEKGQGLSEPKLVPLNMVHSWTTDRVDLRLTPQQLANMPVYIEQLYRKPYIPAAPPAQLGKGQLPATEIFTQEGFPYGPSILPHETKPVEKPEEQVKQPDIGLAEVGPIELRNGAQVEAVDGFVGTLDQLLLDTYMGRITYLVISDTVQKGQELRVPFEWIGYLEPSRIRLSATKEQLRNLVGPPAGPYLSEEGTK